MGTKNKYNLSVLMKAAWEILKAREVKSFSDALRVAWRGIKLKMQMLTDVVEFKFVKVSTSQVRIAHGTLLKSYFEDVFSENMSKPSQYKNITYWDIDKRAWRSFRISTLL